MKRVSVVVPVYFNAESLPLLFDALREVEAELGERGCALELIFVDDGSGDNSLEILLALRARRPATKVIGLARNFGAIPASKVGLRYVTGDCFVWLAADLQDPPALVVEMADRWLAGAKYVIAERSSRHDPLGTRLFASLYYRLMRLLALRDYPRGGFDMLLLDGSLIHYLRDSGKTVNPSLLSYWLGFKPQAIPYERPQRRYGRSRWTFARRLGYFVDSILGFTMAPLRVLTLIGAGVALVSFVGAVAALVSGAPGIPALLALVCCLLGLIMVMIGIVGEYVWRIYDELSRRPEVVIDAVYE